MRPQTQLTPAFIPHATITLAYHGLELGCPSANLSEDRPFTSDPLAAFSIRYQQIARARNLTAPLDLLALGQELFAWLNGPTKFLNRLTDSAPAPLHILFATSREDTPHARTFLDAPWELLADPASKQHWSLSDLIYNRFRHRKRHRMSRRIKSLRSLRRFVQPPRRGPRHQQHRSSLRRFVE